MTHSGKAITSDTTTASDDAQREADPRAAARDIGPAGADGRGRAVERRPLSGDGHQRPCSSAHATSSRVRFARHCTMVKIRVSTKITTPIAAP